MSVGKNARVEGKVTLSSRKRGNDQGSNSINPGIYFMSVFKLSVSLCKDIEMMIHKFWWGQGETKKKKNTLGEMEYFVLFQTYRGYGI